MVYQSEKKKVERCIAKWSIGEVAPLNFNLFILYCPNLKGDSKGSRSADQSGKKEGVINGDPGASVGY